MKLPILLSTLLLSVSPVVAQFDRDKNCIRNKTSTIKDMTRRLASARLESYKPEFIVSLAVQMEQLNQIPKGLTQSEKIELVNKFVYSQLEQMGNVIRKYEAYPDCSKVQGGKR